jgi:hypothetical protein
MIIVVLQLSVTAFLRAPPPGCGGSEAVAGVTMTNNRKLRCGKDVEKVSFNLTALLWRLDAQGAPRSLGGFDASGSP